MSIWDPSAPFSNAIVKAMVLAHALIRGPEFHGSESFSLLMVRPDIVTSFPTLLGPAERTIVRQLSSSELSGRFGPAVYAFSNSFFTSSALWYASDPLLP